MKKTKRPPQITLPPMPIGIACARQTQQDMAKAIEADLGRLALVAGASPTAVHLRKLADDIETGIDIGAFRSGKPN